MYSFVIEDRTICDNNRIEEFQVARFLEHASMEAMIHTEPFTGKEYFDVPNWDNRYHTFWKNDYEKMRQLIKDGYGDIIIPGSTKLEDRQSWKELPTLRYYLDREYGETIRKKFLKEESDVV
jgi:hypothetical protein